MLTLQNRGRVASDYHQPRKEAAVMAADHTLPVDEFNVATFTYKVTRDQPILLDLFVPKSLPSGVRPVLIRESANNQRNLNSANRNGTARYIHQFLW